MSSAILFQSSVVVAYIVATGLLMVGSRWQRAGVLAITLATVGCFAHLVILIQRWQEFGQLPIVTRYEDMTVDALAIAVIYLLTQWCKPQLRSAGVYVLPLAAAGLAAALSYNLGTFPLSPALRSDWLVVHAQLNSVAIGVATLAAAVALLPQSKDKSALMGQLLAWGFFLWAAMVASGSYWASLAWGRYWGWDPIENWALGTLLAYGFVLHLRLRPTWCGRRRDLLSLIPYAMMLFTTYGLLFVRGSIHGQYLFQ
ncbi:Putative cytochrome C-type biogenesis protein [hydrothermal vent metagenome]|uniref:Cytochrome C-type biogenesis protein n=1 Tax=hydrothermal vent metagenome TaxID=652676 RepID=A0A3B1AY03_9ZZZZ